LPPSETPERIGNHATPGCALGESNSQCSSLALGHARGPCRRIIHLLQNTAGVLQKQFPRRAESYASWKALKQREADLFLQVLNLPGERGLSNMKALRSAPIVLLLAHHYEVPQMPQFHIRYFTGIGVIRKMCWTYWPDSGKLIS
jgi:hypothetical protein